MEEGAEIVTAGGLARDLGLTLERLDRFIQRNREVLPPIRGRAGIIRYWRLSDLEAFRHALESERRAVICRGRL